jgi:hypothetical protein
MTRRSHRVAHLLAAAAAAAALAAPTASARLIDGPQDPLRHSDTAGAVEPAPPPAGRPVIVRDIDTGFDWGAAAIGAGGAGALVLLISLGAVAYASRHRAQVT